MAASSPVAGWLGGWAAARDRLQRAGTSLTLPRLSVVAARVQASYSGANWALAPLVSRWHAGAEILAGASGGGGVDSHGSVVQPGVYAAFRLTPTVALRAGEGWVKSPRGSVSSHVVNFGLTVTYGVAAS